jgi:glycosyltransferase involved in cell wall biosynthesis
MDRAEARRDLAAALGVPIDAERPLVAYLGALSEEKHPLLAVEAMAEVPDAQLVVAGAGPLAGEVAARAERASGGRILPVGSLGDPARLLAAADALVITSRSEGIPAVTIEAGLAGLPVVATDVGGVSEVVVDGETGRIVPSFQPRAVAAALREVLGDAGPAMGEAARTRCLTRFALDVVAQQWVPVLDAVGPRAGGSASGTVAG